jgi:hypothetical protein
MTAKPWIGPAWALIGAAVLLSALLQPAGERALVERGMVDMIGTYDLALPLVGLGIALSQMNCWQAILVAVVFAGGIPLGSPIEHRLLVERALSPVFAGYVVLVGPACCVLAAVSLAIPGRLRIWIMPTAAILVGSTLGFLAALHNPSAGDPKFSLGAAATGLWLISLAPAVLRQLRSSWLTIGGRIFASWLAAIGLMLGGAKLVTLQGADRNEAGASTPPLYQPSGAPGTGFDATTPGLNLQPGPDDQIRQP